MTVSKIGKNVQFPYLYVVQAQYEHCTEPDTNLKYRPTAVYKNKFCYPKCD